MLSVMTKHYLSTEKNRVSQKKPIIWNKLSKAKIQRHTVPNFEFVDAGRVSK